MYRALILTLCDDENCKLRNTKMEDHSDKETKSRWQNRKEKLHNTYRLVIMNEETFQEVRSLKLSLMNVYLVISSVIVVVAILVFLLIAYTPLKKYLPGQANIVEREEITQLYEQIDQLELSLTAQKIYTDTFKSLLLGEYESVLAAQEGFDSTDLDKIENIEEVTISAEEIQLRREMELQEIGQAAKRGGIPTAGSQAIPLEQLFFVPPLQGEIIGAFKSEKSHNGVDIIAPSGKAIKSTMDGHVILSDYTYDTGFTIGIQHQNGIISFYKHNAELLKEVGDFVKAGEAIAIIGNTGHQTTGPHLHFELWNNGIPVNPVEYIRF